MFELIEYGLFGVVLIFILGKLPRPLNFKFAASVVIIAVVCIALKIVLNTTRPETYAGAMGDIPSVHMAGVCAVIVLCSLLTKNKHELFGVMLIGISTMIFTFIWRVDVIHVHSPEAMFWGALIGSWGVTTLFIVLNFRKNLQSV